MFSTELVCSPRFPVLHLRTSNSNANMSLNANDDHEQMVTFLTVEFTDLLHCTFLYRPIPSPLCLRRPRKTVVFDPLCMCPVLLHLHLHLFLHVQPP
jgi:hypothetical protein